MDDQRAGSGVFARVSAVQARLPVVIAVQRLEGTAWWRDLEGYVTRRDLDRALVAGQVHRIGRGRYALADLPDARRVAVNLAGVVSHLSAAEQHRIPLLLPPTEAHVTLRANAHPAVPSGVRVHWRRLGQHEVHDGVTSALRTVLDCAASLTFPEGLAVADSALRLNLVTAAGLDGAARSWRGAGARGVRRVVEHADGRAANPFESALRALSLDGGCTGFEPQVHVDVPGAARVDLADVRRRVVLEADSF